MSTVNWVGLVLQVVGLLLAAWLLGRLHEEVKPTKLRVFRWGRSARASVVTFYRRLFRRPGKTTIVEPFTIRATTSLGAPHVTTGRGPLPAGSAEEQIKWLDDFVHDIETKHNELSKKVWELTGTLNNEVSATREYAKERIGTAVDEARADFRSVVGKDLGWEVVSLVMIAVGVVLAYI